MEETMRDKYFARCYLAGVSSCEEYRSIHHASRGDEQLAQARSQQDPHWGMHTGVVFRGMGGVERVLLNIQSLVRAVAGVVRDVRTV